MIDNKPPDSLTEAESKKIHVPSEKWSDEFALKVATQDFNAAEVYRTSNLDYRWANADQLYLAWVQTKYWEGTRIPRANIGVYTAFEQIESFLPKVVGAIFADYPNWFQCDPRPGTLPDEARAVSNLIISQMENLNSHGISTIREVVRRCFKSGFTYGNGVAELSWLSKEEKRFYTIRQGIPEKVTISHPLLGPMSIPTGKINQVIRQVPYTEKTNQPFLRYIPIKDFYIDPNCPSPIISDARYCATRKLLSVDEVASYRGQQGFKVPSDEDLNEMVKQRPTAQADFTKSQTEAMRQMWWQPQMDTSLDPGSKRLEVIAYWTRDRLVWTINRTYTMFNEPNPYGFIPLYDFFYTDVIDRFYGLAITDVVEGEQRLQQSIINARIDELALCINRPMIKKRGTNVPAYQLKTRPGQVIEAENPKDDIILGTVQNITQEAYIEVQASDLRVQKTTGGSSLALLGTSQGGGNSANRTAAGVNTQSAATGSRIQYLVENAEDTAIEQFLSDWHTMNQRFMDPEQIIKTIGQTGQFIQIDPLTIINSRVKFGMRASAKMQARTSLIQMMPLFAQTILNPAFMQQLASQQKKTVNIEEFFNMVLDATGYRNREALFRPLSQEELQAMNQPPIEEQIKMQMQQERIQGQASISEDKQLADMVREVIKATLAHKGQAAQNEHDMTHLITDRLLQHNTAIATKELDAKSKEPTE